MIARTNSARSTRDIDLVSAAVNIEEALDELKRLASVDLKDFITYTYVRSEEIKTEDEYRTGYKAVFTPHLGTTKKSDVSIDLVVDSVVCEKAERLEPKGRLAIDSLESYDYLLYPVVNSIADKICATMQHYDGKNSSRVKDLVDLVIYLTTEIIDAETLRKQVITEAALRKMAPIERFIIPQSWSTTDQGRYKKLALETTLPEEYQQVGGAYKFVSGCIDQLLAGKAADTIWNSKTLRWEEQ